MDNQMIDDRIIREELKPASDKLIRNPWDMDVFKLAYGTSLMIHKKTLDFPKTEQYALANQLRRSSKSICANIAEGFIRQKYSRAEFARFVAIAEASACETQIWLRYALDLGYIDHHVFAGWDADYARIVTMLAKLHSKLM